MMGERTERGSPVLRLPEGGGGTGNAEIAFCRVYSGTASQEVITVVFMDEDDAGDWVDKSEPTEVMVWPRRSSTEYLALIAGGDILVAFKHNGAWRVHFDIRLTPIQPATGWVIEDCP